MVRIDLGDNDTPARRLPSALLLLADGRFPGGGHAHSGGLEAAAAIEGVRDVPNLEEFLRGRVASAGAVSAAFAGAACAAMASPSDDPRTPSRVAILTELDGELEARIPSPALRATSHRLGRQLMRAGARVWPNAGLGELAAVFPGGLHHAVCLGAVGAAAGLSEPEVVLAAVHDCVASPAAAAVRLLGLDPFTVHEALAKLGPLLDTVAAEGASHVHSLPAELPSWSAPLLDVLAERHAAWEVRLFAS